MGKLLVAAVAAMAVSACATTGNGNGSAVAKVSEAAGSKYCWRDRLEPIGRKYACNWTPSRAEACAGNAAYSTVDISGHAGPFETAACENGPRLVVLRPKG